jgi:hypothetical protein
LPVEHVRPGLERVQVEALDQFRPVRADEGESPWKTAVMAYDTELADRVGELVHDEDGVTEKRMFGGLAYLINGNMAVAASSQGGLLLRVDPDDTDALVADPHADRFVMRGRQMNGWLHVDPAGLATTAQLERWVTCGVAYARSLPPKR